MADDKKKPKIDLKARLGKTVQGTAVPGGLTPIPTGVQPGSAPPPPPAADGTPVPVPAPKPNIVPPPSIKPTGIAPPAAITGGISLPSFNRPAAPKKEVVSAEAQTIKVEVGEEIIAERKKYTRFIVIAAIVGAGAGIGIGFLAGGRSEQSHASDLAIKGSSELQKEVSQAAKKLKELDQMFADMDSLDTETYPKDLSGKLASITIAFDDSKISGPAVGALPSKVIKSLLAFKQGCDNVQEKKEALKNMLTDKTQKDLEQAWADVRKPPFKNSIIFKGGGEKTFAELVNNKDSFTPADGSWPKEYKITVQEQKDNQMVDVDKTVNRWEKGDLTGVEGKTMAIPLDPGRGARTALANLIGPLKAQVASIKRLIYGDNTPGREVKGLLHPDENTKGLAEELDASLNEISLKK